MKKEELIGAAKREDWDFVDKEIQKICNDPSYIKWASENGIKDDDGNVRDLAVSILEKAKFSKEKFEEISERLYNLMVSDENPYVRYRSAFALTAHEEGKYREEVREVLEEAKNDPDVSYLAKKYLLKMKIFR